MNPIEMVMAFKGFPTFPPQRARSKASHEQGFVMPEPGLVMPPSARRCTPARQEGLNAPSHGVKGDRKCGSFPVTSPR